ncbi:MAG: L,D-transpeptidase family protein [Actinomycetota bacterium]|nr:L,D-transpeptidase family protein [Actinomycetota bacterium]
MLTTNRTLKLAVLVAATLAPLGLAAPAFADPRVGPIDLQPLTTLLTPSPPATPAPAAPAGPDVPSALQVEHQLDLLHFDPGPVDGAVDEDTSHAVMAFQKAFGMERTGQLTDPVATTIMATTAPPSPLHPGGGANRVEIDLTRQILMVYEGDSLARVLPVSSGTADTPTPTGSYTIYRRVSGWETSPLGRLYNSQYFVGGYAIHGSLSVPGHPASHGCVRIPMRAADWLPHHVGFGTPVYVMGG